MNFSELSPVMVCRAGGGVRIAVMAGFSQPNAKEPQAMTA